MNQRDDNDRVDGTPVDLSTAGPAASITPPQARNSRVGNRVVMNSPSHPNIVCGPGLPHYSVAAMLQHRSALEALEPVACAANIHVYDVSSACSPVADDSAIASDASGSVGA